MNERASMAAAGPDLPRWDLSDLFPGPDSPELKSALAAAFDGARAFAAAHRGRLAELDGARLGAATAEYER
ncbi:MAG: M3 family oligoendopeptidase, partial [Pseudomonadota bacterium]